MSAVLTRKVVEKVWGRSNLPTHFGVPDGRKIGEIWFEPLPGHDDHLVKILFSSEKLSVQVHPSQSDARRLGFGSRGKDECWLVLDAEPGSKVALGLDEDYTSEAVRAAALDGSIEDMLVWYEARAGDFFHVPAGTIHAIGPGLTILEVQQNTDVTFRLFDYNRGRTLHVDHAMECAKLERYAGCKQSGSKKHTDNSLIDTVTLKVSMFEGAQTVAVDGTKLLIPVEGSAHIGTTKLTTHQCAMVEPGETAVLSDDSCVVVVDL